MQVINKNFPLDATYEELLELFKPVDVAWMERVLKIAIDLEEYLYAPHIFSLQCTPEPLVN